MESSRGIALQRLRATGLAALCAAALLASVPAQAQAPQQAAVPAPYSSILYDPAFARDVRQGLDYLYDMDFAGADAVFAEVASRYPGHPVGPMLEALVDWWTILLEPSDTSQDDAFLAAMDEVIARSDHRLKADPRDIDAMFFKSGAHAFRGRLHADRKRWLRAARDGQQGMKYLQKVVERDPNNNDLYFGVGLFDYLADVAPKQYRILRPFKRLFPQGNRERGLRELERAMNQGQFVSAETAYSLLQIHYIFEKNYGQSLRYALWLRARYPGNSLFHLYEGRSYERLGRAGEAAHVLRQVLDRYDKGQSGYTDSVAEQALYVLSRLEMQRNQYDLALAHIDRLERLSSRRAVDTEYKALGRLRKGMAFDAYGRRKEAVHCYKEVLGMKEGPDWVRDRAKTYLRKPFRDERVVSARR